VALPGLRPYLAPFVDTGRSFDGIDLKFEDWKVGFGLGFRLAWNLSTVISFDFGVSSEDRIFYMELGTQL
jgi:outer membrane translocation and assembly module TamA